MQENQFTEDWAYLLEAASMINYWTMGEFTLVYPAPDNRGTLILRDHMPFLAEERSLEAVEKFFTLHRLMDYQLMKRVCQSLKPFPSKKVPIVNTHFVLFPLTKPEDSIWLNPLAIHQVIDKGSVCLVVLTNGLTVEVPIIRKSLITIASKAVYSLATYRQDYSATMLTDGRPLDYVQLPATPFGCLLSKHELLQEWLLTPGEFITQYKLEEHHHWYRSYTGDLSELDD
ncbi:hypothetical protein IGI42_004137 [Enterococcus sp. AZ109]